MPAIQATLRTALAAMLAALRENVDGTGSYNNDLTDAPAQRVRAHVPNPILVTQPSVFVRSISGFSSPVGVPLGTHDREGQVTFACYAGGTQVEDSEVYEVIDLVSDIDRCLMAERANPNSDLMGAVLDIVQTGCEIQPVWIGNHVYGEALVTYRLSWISDYAGGI